MLKGAYCLTCKAKTDDVDPKTVEKESGTWCQSTCKGCGKKKSCRAKGSSPTVKKTKGSGGLAPAGQYFIPNDPVETGVQTKGDGPPQGISNIRMGMGQSLAASGVLDGSLERTSILGPNWNPLRPTLPQLPTVDNYQAYFPGTELPTGRAGNGFDNQRQNQIPPTSANSVNYGQPTYGNTSSKSRVEMAAEKAAIAGTTFPTMGGGSLAALAPLALDAFSAAKAAVDESPGAARIRARLARLREMQGSGVNPTKQDGQELGFLVAQGDREALKQAKQLLGKSGSGLRKGGWEDFWEGFKFGFTNPLESFELLGREIKEAFSPSPKPLTQAQLKAQQDVMDIINKTAGRGFKNKDRSDPLLYSQKDDMAIQKKMEKERELADFESRMQKEKELLMKKHQLDVENEPRVGNLGLAPVKGSGPVPVKTETDLAVDELQKLKGIRKREMQRQAFLNQPEEEYDEWPEPEPVPVGGRILTPGEIDGAAASALDKTRKAAKKRLRLSAKQESQTRTESWQPVPYKGRGVKKSAKGKKAPKKSGKRGMSTVRSGGLLAMNPEHAFGEQDGLPQNHNVMLNLSGTGFKNL